MYRFYSVYSSKREILFEEPDMYVFSSINNSNLIMRYTSFLLLFVVFMTKTSLSTLKLIFQSKRFDQF